MRRSCDTCLDMCVDMAVGAYVATMWLSHVFILVCIHVYKVRGLRQGIVRPSLIHKVPGRANGDEIRRRPDERARA